jgi:hypothetical protein
MYLATELQFETYFNAVSRFMWFMILNHLGNHVFRL